MLRCIRLLPKNAYLLPWSKSVGKQQKPQFAVYYFTQVNIYENTIFLYYKKENDQNDPKSLFLDAFINVEISFYKLARNIQYWWYIK